MNSHQNTIAITWTNDKGFGIGKSSNSLSALIRPYKQLFEEGKPVGKVNYVFFKTSKLPSFIVGALCFTPCGRILFYPGLVSRYVNWECINGQLKPLETKGLIDHITLEKDFKHWHFTILDEKAKKTTRLPNRHTRIITSEVTFWFGLTLRDLGVLEQTPQELTVYFSTSAKDADRRIKEFQESQEQAINHLLQIDLAEDKNTINIGEFLHLDFFLAPKNINIIKFPCFAPTASPVVKGYYQTDMSSILCRAHPVNLEGIKQKIWIVVTRHKGLPKEKSIFY